MMRMAVLQHVEFEGPAAVADWAAGRGFPLRLFHLNRVPTLPSLSDFDMMTVMGGPMSANDEVRFEWLGTEIALVRAAIAAGKTVVGICLGAQIIAKAMGARVYPGRAKEIGWFPVRRTAVSHPFFDGLPETFTPFHWHGETFDLPHEAKLLAKSKITKTQAFAVGQRVLGLQFHLEATEERVRALLKSAHEIGHGAFEQRPGVILASLEHCASLRPLLDTVLDRLAGFAGRGK